VKNRKIFTSAFIIALVFSLVLFAANQPSASAHTIFLGRKGENLDIELSPKQRLFHPDEDGYFYPGSPKITKYLKVINVGDLPFRICRFNATFGGDVFLANGLQMEILELGKGKGEKPNLLYKRTLSGLAEGVEVNGKRAIPSRQSVTLQLTVWMPETAGNEYQGLSMTADIVVTVRFPPAHDGGNG
jgi:hypothetical protein